MSNFIIIFVIEFLLAFSDVEINGTNYILGLSVSVNWVDKL